MFAVVVASTTPNITGGDVTSSVRLVVFFNGFVTVAQIMILDKREASGLQDRQSVNHQKSIFAS